MLRGVIRLGRNEAYKLYKMIRNFLDEHEQKGTEREERELREYAPVACPLTQANE